MGRREEIEKLSEVAYESEDLATLEQTHQQFGALLASMRQNLQTTTDEDVVNLLNELIEHAESADQDLKQKIAAIRVDMMDPQYAARKAEREREEAAAQAAEQAKAAEMTRKLQEGIGGFLGSLGLGGAFGAAVGGAAKPAAPAAPAAPGAPAGAAAGAKFCSECGTPLAGAKFCPECGTKAS
jgi:chromosome segregation ATPase